MNSPAIIEQHHLEMDCKEVVDACHSFKADFSEFGCLIKEC